jgi:phosphatidylglycerol:prolipoprotein diacylglycerol transferase
MWPILFVIPGWDFKIHSYGVMIFVACMSATVMAARRVRHEGIHPNAVYELATWLFLGGIVGAKVFYILQDPEAIAHAGEILRGWQGGNVFYGCITGGFIGSVLYWFRRPFPFWPMADAVAPAVALGAGLGRIGCFLGGCCDGGLCNLPWAVRFPAGSHAWTRQLNAGLIGPDALVSLPVHPTQVYAIIGGLGVTCALLLYYPHRRRNGELWALLMILYPLTRWPIEALRADSPAVIAGMDWSQLFSVAVLAGGLAIWLGLGRNAEPGTGTSRSTTCG